MMNKGGRSARGRVKGSQGKGEWLVGEREGTSGRVKDHQGKSERLVGGKG